jgi:hypothetical protein
VRLTKKGKALAEVTHFYRQHFLPKKRVLLGEVTDDLTDPFRDSLNIVNTECPNP